jgi:hypothetical protein
MTGNLTDLILLNFRDNKSRLALLIVEPQLAASEKLITCNLKIGLYTLEYKMLAF